jgi:NADPH:quinone reductase-like Zn-dependent oxidoreductase
MHIFVTGGSGLTGPAVVSELIASGHTFTGLARSDESAARLEALGAAAHRGSLEDRDSLRKGGSLPGPVPRAAAPGIGCDVSGTVDAVGEGVSDVAVGDLVFGTDDWLVARSPLLQSPAAATTRMLPVELLAHAVTAPSDAADRSAP